MNVVIEILNHLEFLRFLASVLFLEFSFFIGYARKEHFVKRCILSVCALAAFTALLGEAAFFVFGTIDNSVVVGVLRIAVYVAIWLASVAAVRICYDEKTVACFACGAVAYAVQHMNYNLQHILFLLMFRCPFSPGFTLSAYVWNNVLSLIVTLLVYGSFFLFCRRFAKRYGRMSGHRAGIAVLSLSTLFIALVFNAFRDVFASESVALDILVSCLLTAVCVFIACTGCGIFDRNTLENEKASLKELLKRERTQYELKKAHADFINMKCHDIKHLLGGAHGKKNTFTDTEISELEDSVGTISAQHDTGNETLDILLTEWSLYCNKNDLDFSCVADGSGLGFVSVADICSLFGNIMENAVRAAKKAKQNGLGYIWLSVKNTKGGVCVTARNGCVDTPVMAADGTLSTTKADKRSHGFGLKSINYIAEKYSGAVKISVKDNVFDICVTLFPPE